MIQRRVESTADEGKRDLGNRSRDGARAGTSTMLERRRLKASKPFSLSSHLPPPFPHTPSSANCSSSSSSSAAIVLVCAIRG
jgi:hypothetical protein